MKRFVTEDSFWELFPGASFGVVVAQNMKSPEEVDPEAVAEVAHLLDRANLQAEKHLESNTLSENAAVHM